MNAYPEITTARPVERLGYVSSGQFAADYKMQEAQERWQIFLSARRNNAPIWKQRDLGRDAIFAYRFALDLKRQVRIWR